MDNTQYSNPLSGGSRSSGILLWTTQSTLIPCQRIPTVQDPPLDNTVLLIPYPGHPDHLSFPVRRSRILLWTTHTSLIPCPGSSCGLHTVLSPHVRRIRTIAVRSSIADPTHSIATRRPWPLGMHLAIRTGTELFQKHHPKLKPVK